MKNLCAVVVPIYQTRLSAHEEISLTQLYKILGRHDIVYVYPEKLDLKKTLGSFYPAKDHIAFDASFFESVHGYNRLMLSTAFYARFEAYNYILLYQPDAFVFSDQLHFWCKKGFDYIGAPWLRYAPYPDGFKKLKNRIIRYMHIRYNKKQEGTDFPTDIQIENKVGNGGFSLRNVEKFISLSQKYKRIADHYIASAHPTYNEDRFWSVEVNRKKTELRIPRYKEALHFAFETKGDRAWEISGHTLPFGCHAWEKEMDFWKPFLQKEGYIL